MHSSHKNQTQRESKRQKERINRSKSHMSELIMLITIAPIEGLVVVRVVHETVVVAAFRHIISIKLLF